MNVMSYNMVHNVLEFLRFVVASLREPVLVVSQSCNLNLPL